MHYDYMYNNFRNSFLRGKSITQLQLPQKVFYRKYTITVWLFLFLTQFYIGLAT